MKTLQNATDEIENVRFIFPNNHELALYALATLQSFVEHYYKSMERLHIWDQKPELMRKLRVLLTCNQSFYLTFQDSFPDCVEYVPPSIKAETDELCVVLHEKALEDYEPTPGYSIQWFMGQLAGTKPQLIPVINTKLMTIRPYVDQHYVVHMDNVQFINTDVANRNCDIALGIASQASLIIAPQGMLTVLGTALGKPVVEVTKTASHRPFLGVQNYVQVSRLTPDKFFQNSLDRGVAWLHKKITSQSPVSNVAALSADSQLVLESPSQPAKSA